MMHVHEHCFCATLDHYSQALWLEKQENRGVSVHTKSLFSSVTSVMVTVSGC